MPMLADMERPSGKGNDSPRLTVDAKLRQPLRARPGKGNELVTADAPGDVPPSAEHGAQAPRRLNERKIR